MKNVIAVLLCVLAVSCRMHSVSSELEETLSQAGSNRGELFRMLAKFSEFDLQRLEERLETDPLMVDGLLSVATAIDDTSSFAPLDNEEECTHCSGSVTCNVH